MTPNQKREEIKRLLSLLEDDNRHMFMLMYAGGSTTRDINHVVDSLSTKKLDHALYQCKNTYYKIFKVLKGS